MRRERPVVYRRRRRARPVMTPLLSLSDIAVAFGGVQAVRGVSFDIRPGEVHALVGENGAGKSTLIRVMTGAVRADTGTVAIGGQPVERPDPTRMRALGVAPIYQQPALLPDLSVAENLAFGLEHGRAFRRIDWRARRARATELLARVGIALDLDRPAGTLRMAEQQLVEIARALGTRAKVLLLDEPTAALTDVEAARLFTLVARPARRRRRLRLHLAPARGSHGARRSRVGAARRPADGDAADRRGDARRHGPADGRPRRRSRARRPASRRRTPAAKDVLALHDVGCAASRIAGVSLRVARRRDRRPRRPGRRRPHRAGARAVRPDAGRRRHDRDRRPRRAPSARRPRPCASASPTCPRIGDNTASSARCRWPPTRRSPRSAASRRFGLLDRAAERAEAQRFVTDFAIRTPSIDAPVGTLSGGNQQKVALARWLATKPRLLILDEPTQGVDIGAKAEIHRLIRALAADGLAILLISSELTELLGLAHRIGVMRGGRLVGVLDHADATEERLMSLALGHTPLAVGAAQPGGAAPPGDEARLA